MKFVFILIGRIIIFSLFLFVGIVLAAPVSDTGNVQITLEVEGLPQPTPPPAPLSPPSPLHTLFDISPPAVYNLSIFISSNSATVKWETSEPALCQLFWGLTPEHEVEGISEIDYGLKHIASFINLSPERTYHFQIVTKDRAGNVGKTTDSKFTTLPAPDTIPPVNVSNFKAIPGDGEITLTWKNPPDPDFKAVKIMRSTRFYPADPWTGETVYNKKGTSFTDRGLTNTLTYYYTAFAYDDSGNYASGATVSATPQAAVPPVKLPPIKPPVVAPPPEIEKLTLEDFVFAQEGKRISLIDGKKIKIRTGPPVTIYIDYAKFPEVLKIIMITLEKDERSFSFLLRVNEEKTAFSATLLPPEEPGIYSLTITTLDFKNQALKQIFGELEVEKVEVPTPTLAVPWYQRILNKILSLLARIWQWIKNFFLEIF